VGNTSDTRFSWLAAFAERALHTEYHGGGGRRHQGANQLNRGSNSSVPSRSWSGWITTPSWVVADGKTYIPNFTVDGVHLNGRLVLAPRWWRLQELREQSGDTVFIRIPSFVCRLSGNMQQGEFLAKPLARNMRPW
jgi:hypothetical protein